MPETRIEYDSLGPMTVPAAALYGAQTARAIENFPVSGLTFPRPFLRALAQIKEQAAYVNLELGLLEDWRAQVIAAATSSRRANASPT